MTQVYNSAGVPIVSQVTGVSLGSINVSAGTTSNNLTNLVFSNGGNVTFGLSGSTVTASAPAGGGGGGVGLNTAQTNVTWTVNTSGISFNAAGYAGTGTSATNASITLNSNGLAISVAPGGGGGITNINVSAGTTSNNLSALTFSNANGITFGLNASTLTASHNGLTSQSNPAYSAANGSGTFQTLSFANSNGVSFSTGTQGVFATVATNYLTTARASNDAVGLNTAQTNVTWTVNSAGISLNAGGYAGTGTSATNASVTLNSNGLAISVAAPGGGGAINVSAGTTSGNLQTIQFNNSNGVSFGLNGSTITASAAGGGGGATLEGLQPVAINTFAALGHQNGTLFVVPFDVPQNLSVSYAGFLASVSLGTANNTSVSSGQITYSLALYSLNGSTLSLITSGSQSYSASGSSNALTASVAGFRQVTVPIDWVTSPGNYWFGLHARSTGTAATFSIGVVTHGMSNFSGPWFSASNSNTHPMPFLGVYATSFSSAMPDSIGPTQIAVTAPRIPYLFFSNRTV